MSVKARKSKDMFIWTDDEVELLLKVTKDYKAAMAVENVDWESCQNKYNDIYNRFKEDYPSPNQTTTRGKDYPHKKEEITKGQVTTKLKAIRFRYRQAVDSGRKNGHGRVVLLYFELCESIWGSSPAPVALPEGVETSNIGPEVSEQTSAGVSSPVKEELEDVSVSAEIESRRQRLTANLRNHRREKLKKKLSSDALALEDLEIKRRLLRQLETTDNEFVQTMGRWSSTMDRLNSNIEMLVQHIIGSGNRGYMPMPSPSPHAPLQSHYSYDRGSEIQVKCEQETDSKEQI